MKRVSVFIYEDAVLSAISGALDILMGTNEYVKDRDGEKPFHIDLVGEKLKNIQLRERAQFMCDRTIADPFDADLIIIPAFNGTPGVVLEKNHPVMDWIADRYHAGTEIASLCYGSYFLAEAGLLTDKPCTSHWMAIDDMRQRYPDIQMLPDAVVTDRDGVYTSGGAFLSLNLLLYLVEKFCGRGVAVPVSKMFSVDMSRASQSHFAVFQGQRGHDDGPILDAQTVFESNYDGDLSIEEVAEQANMSRRTFIRRFKRATKNTPLEYLQRVRVEAAKKALEQTGHNISAVMYDVGYSDAKMFRKVFKRYTGLTPSDYRRKYRRALPTE